MILVVGGLASGKRTYLHSLGYNDALIGQSIGSNAPALYGLEEILRKGPLGKEELDSLMHKDVVVCCEVGLGVVPTDASERAWRELVGRTCCQLAEQASMVVRMVCGIPVTIRRETMQEA